MNRPDRELLRELFDAAVAAVSPAKCLPPHLPAAARRGARSSSAPAKRRRRWRKRSRITGARPLAGLVVTRYGHGVPCARIEVVEAAHPVPDAAGRKAALRILETVKGLTADDLVLCLISGGGSALLAAPAGGLTLEDKQAVNKRAAQVRREHHRDELRAQAPLGDQGRTACCGRRAGPRRDARDLRRAGRRSVGDRIGPDRARSRPRSPTRSPCLPSTESPSHAPQSSTCKRGRDETPKPGDPRLAARRGDRDRHRSGSARSRGGGGARRRGGASDPRRFDRR